MRILVTGGAGFIGSHLADRLRERGNTVEIIDPGWPSKGQAASGWPVTCQQIEGGDLHSRWDFIYHLASTVGVTRVLEDPAACIENNIESLRAVLGLGIPGLFTSTSEVYGRNESVLREDSAIVLSSAPRWSYAASKLVCEWMALQAGWNVVRLFNVVGPRQSSGYGAVLPRFVTQALAGAPLTVYGDGSQTRTFIDVRDCVDILDRLRPKQFGVVNVGGVHTLAIRDLAIRVWHEVNGDWPIKLATEPYELAYPPGFEECPARVPDLTKLEALLPELPYSDLSTTIRDLADWIKPSLEVKENVEV